ncbi:oligopeptide/dipeptide ABC transporter ATP-binding protein [Desulfosarcina sp.]|uniref:ABC transporter ATP-binding protein n=1 Tax=Desulfosarcina sp. TaxID=2027861 RepID=UPI0029A66055|nr:oligopeptide/dipeptide ABC transporter ATP-binding protein [Desulfosarcina sp.]MDX2455469.1 ATP-binding cassette domain-containing protein [Desulfosarcina sp.]MDX2492960.1 ATP-binding cassette domain-containing protein [Desulfosarcina sp.]
MKESLITVRDLNIHFPIKRGVLSRTVGYVYAVDGVSFELAKGETLGIVGESGCGKTTAGMAVTQLIPITSGKVTWKGQDMRELSRSGLRKLRREMQLIFQDPYSSLNPRMRVDDILSDPMDVHGMFTGKQRRERLAFLLETVGLAPEQGRRFPHEFSGGQRQRIGIARALALDPSVIIGDEPVSALDVSIQAQIINLLMDLKANFDLSLIIISHDLAVVEYICDRIVVMYLGKVMETAVYSDLYGSPKHPYTQALLSAVPVPDPLRKKERIILKGDVPSPIDPPSGCRFHTRCPERMDICDKTVPEMIDFGNGHQAACHLYTRADAQ